MNLKDLQKIIDILKESDVNEFHLEEEGTSIKLIRGVSFATQSQVNTYATPQYAQQQQQMPTSVTVNVPVNAVTEAIKEDEGLFKVESPIVGTFFRKPSPDSPSFAEVGKVVKKGDKLCIIEAMKLMNEIDAPISGTIEKILAQDGQVVEFGEPLFLIRPS